MGFFTQWAVVFELLTAASFCAAFGFGWVALEGITEDAWQDARDEAPLDAECAQTQPGKGQRR